MTLPKNQKTFLNNFMDSLLLTTDEMAEIDNRAINEFGVPGVCLMENAGVGVVRAMQNRYGNMKDRRIGILAGKGKNGGDGFVIARHLHNLGSRVHIYCLFDPDESVGDTSTHLNIVRKMGIHIEVLKNEEAVSQSETSFRDMEFWVDAVFGTGLNANPKGHIAKALSILTSMEIPIISVDIPSGLLANTGQPTEIALRADMTVTFGFPKLGHILYPGPDYSGRLIVSDIGIPKAAANAQGVKTFLLESDKATSLFPKYPADAHKGNFGHVLVLAGATGKMGAGYMAAEAVLRAGAGLVTLGYPKGAISLGPTPPEIMTLPLASTTSGTFSNEAILPGLEAASMVDAVVIGPGITTQKETVSFVHDWLVRCDRPMVVDADALNAMALGFAKWNEVTAPLCLTPHPGEFSRLTGQSIKEVQTNRIEAARKFSSERTVEIALKGARTILASPNGEVWVNMSGSAVLASGGTGDVLAGAVGSFLAQGLSPAGALQAAVHLHGIAGDLASQKHGQRGVLASDIMHLLPDARKKLVHPSIAPNVN